MKQFALIISAFTFSTLFYDKSIGLNLSIFSLVVLLILVLYNPQRFKDKNVILLTVTYLFTGALVFIQNTGLSILANCAAFFTLVGMVSEVRASIYIHWINGMFTTIAGFFYRNFDVSNEDEKVNWKRDIDVLHWAKLIGIPLVFIIIFVLLYKNGNPVFEDLIDQINFDFINFQWLLFSVLGYYLFSNISKPIIVEPATSLDLQISNRLKHKSKATEEQLKKEQQLGTTLLGLLNVLIIIFVITDIISIVNSHDLQSFQMSNQVHKGVNTLIASIIIAIVIILYFFRGELNFYSKNNILKQLTYSWIILNMILVALIAVKNYNYITTFGLTYKRIGVNVYIFLTLIGLISTFIKVLKVRNLAFLFRRNIQVAFVTLMVLSAINWDLTITKYNIKKSKKFIGIDYLISLSERNAYLLYTEKDKLTLPESDLKKIENKFRAYRKAIVHHTWQEHSLESLQLVKTSKTKN